MKPLSLVPVMGNVLSNRVSLFFLYLSHTHLGSFASPLSFHSPLQNPLFFLAVTLLLVPCSPPTLLLLLPLCSGTALWGRVVSPSPSGLPSFASRLSLCPLPSVAQVFPPLCGPRAASITVTPLLLIAYIVLFPFQETVAKKKDRAYALVRLIVH